MTSDRSYSRLILLSLMVLGFLAFDVAVPLLMGGDEDLVDFLALGCCIGQLNLIAAWAALAPGNVAIRLPWAMLLAVFMWYALVIGNRIVPNNFIAASDAAFLGALLVGAVLVLQIPLWIARGLFRWRLESKTETGEPKWQQYSMWHLLVGMLLFSMALAPMRLVLPAGDIFDFQGPGLLEFSVIMALALICNLLITMPTIWGAFLRGDMLVLAGVAWIFYSGMLTAAEFLIMVLFAGAPSDDSTIIFYILTINLTQCVTVLLALLALRGLGFRLTRGASPAH